MRPAHDAGRSRVTAARVRAAMLRALRPMPELSAWVHDTWIAVDASASTFAMSRDGVLVAPERSALELPEPDLDFIVAHELLHRVLHHHERGAGAHARRFNVAADYVINGMLMRRLGREPPLGGVHAASLTAVSAEKAFFALESSAERSTGEDDIEDRDRRPARRRRNAPPRWGWPAGHSAEVDPRDIAGALCVTNELLHSDVDDVLGRGGQCYRESKEVSAERMDAEAIAKHLVQNTITESKARTYDRRSRRQSAMRDDTIVLAGRKRRRENAWRIVVDVSLSCTRLYPESFGLAADLIRRAELGPTDVLLTDGETIEWLRDATPESLRHVRVNAARGAEYHCASMLCSNCGRPYAYRHSNRCFGSLVPAFTALEAEGARGAVVFSDGLIGAPTATTLDDVLFVLEPLPARNFAPSFGRIVDHPVKLQPSE